MFAFGFLLVPLYEVMCKITGIGGRTNTVAATISAAQPDDERLITVEFVAAVNEQAPWEFRPDGDLDAGTPRSAVRHRRSLPAT